MVDEQYFASFCHQILNEHPSIRFVGLADRQGHLITTAYRKNLVPLMDSKDTEKYTFQTVIRASMREVFEDKIGKQRYAVGLYEKLIRATIPIAFSSNKNRKFYLLMSFDLDSDYGHIIERKILPIIKEHKEYFM
ncbi:MAG: hypothetical protein QXX64_06955 [Nitrososphaera sp.]|uniref:Roadblock/LAMTOR2 domain-containing protein n=1 Tax=Nitrososphaera gargensis (strain Ga9.2) TaxID=1237085 RepID=K0I8L7_NITGG|nr:hypothetical protein [Candidatus Nitrososphaera gargensis]AFU57626.1 hypothetical protein Ngar_c06830 [Candidatus Nitrososphaera gargensis Ga9.2]